jgi:hypothetical protein
MARTTKKNSLVPTLTDKLMATGHDVNEYDEGDVVEVDGKSYFVKMVGDKKVFEEYVEEELKAEPYEEKVVEPEVVAVAEEKPKKERKPRAKKDKVEVVELVEEADPMEVVEVAKPEEPVGAEEKPKKERKPRAKKEEGDEKPKRAPKKSKVSDGEDVVEGEKKRKKRDPSKPKRIREKTCFNVFVSERMFELKDSHPNITGRERFSEACKLWKALGDEERQKLQDKFKTDNAKPAVVEVEA